MRNQLLLCKEENTILLFVDPNRNMSFFCGISNQEHCPQLTQFAELIEADPGLRGTPLAEKNFLVEPCHKRMGVLEYLFRARLPQM